MAKKNAREEPPKPQVSENEQMSDIVFILDKMELILEAINTRTEQSSAVETVPVRSASFPEPEEDSIPGEISLA
jgi:hypothetical protein